MATPIQQKSKVVQVRRFRVKVGRHFCTLSTKFHELGVCIPDAPSEAEAFAFRTLQAANNAVERTCKARDEVARSVIRDYEGFKPLNFDGHLHVEEFLTVE